MRICSSSDLDTCILLIQKDAAEAREAAEAASANGRVPVENGDVEGAAAPEVAKFGWIVGVLVRRLLHHLMRVG